MRCENGLVVWEGPSRFDGKSPVVVYLQLDSDNKKIGRMAQAWILRADMPPHEAVRRKLDRAICGECPRTGGRGCYVVTNRLVKLWNTIPFCERVEPEVAARRIAGMRLRIGAYGDPAAVPASVWKALTRFTLGHTSYTHSPGKSPTLRGMSMASAESPEHARELQAQGWKTYRIRRWTPENVPEPLLPGEIECPADEHSSRGKRTSCAECLLCGSRQKKNVAIVEHSGSTMSRLARLRKKGLLPEKKTVTAKDIVRGALDQMPDVEVARLVKRLR